MEWEQGAVKEAIITSTTGGICRLYCETSLAIQNHAGELQEFTKEKQIVEFATTAGHDFVIKIDR